MEGRAGVPRLVAEVAGAFVVAEAGNTRVEQVAATVFGAVEAGSAVAVLAGSALSGERAALAADTGLAQREDTGGGAGRAGGKYGVIGAGGRAVGAGGERAAEEARHLQLARCHRGASRGEIL